MEGQESMRRGKMRWRNFIVAAILLAVLQGNAAAIWIDYVEVVPEEPLNIDIITFNIDGRAGGTPSQVAYDEFSQDGTSLQLDLYVDVGMSQAFSNWTYSKQIGMLNAGAYSLEVRAFDNYYNTLWDTYTVDFAVVPEPASFVLFGLGLLIVRPLSRRKG